MSGTLLGSNDLTLFTLLLFFYFYLTQFHPLFRFLQTLDVVEFSPPAAVIDSRRFRRRDSPKSLMLQHNFIRYLSQISNSSTQSPNPTYR